ncbi:hypothetical protein Dimus_014523 [Dionaea muscipula]
MSAAEEQPATPQRLSTPLLLMSAAEEQPAKMAKRSSKSRKPGSSASRKKAVKLAEETVLVLAEEMPQKKKKKKKKKSDVQKSVSKKPKKPPTALFYSLEDFSEVYQEENLKIKSIREIGKAGGKKWKTMTYEEKVQYYDTAAEKRAEFDRAMGEYNKKQESGGANSLRFQNLMTSRKSSRRVE